MADFSEFWVARDNGRALFNRAGEKEAVSISNAVVGFVLSRLVDELSRDRKNGEVQTVDVGQHLDLSPIPKSAFGRIQDFAEIDRAEVLGPSPT